MATALVLLVLVRVESTQQAEDADDLSAYPSHLLDFEEGEEDVQKVGVVVVRLNHIAVGT